MNLIPYLWVYTRKEILIMSNLKPFTKFCRTIGILPTSYKVSLTYEEQLIFFCDFLENKVIPAINDNAEALQETQNLLAQLKTYVDDYFDNLDLQQEVENVLDEMVESGELEQIISVYLNTNAVLSFDTVAQMVASDKLVEGSVVRTLGETTFNDKKGHFYKILKIQSANPDGVNLINLGRDDLYAQLIYENKIINDLSSQDNPQTNAPSIEAVKTAIDLINNAIQDKANSSDVYTKLEANELLNDKQDELVSGQNIKTINNNSILGLGNIETLLPADILNQLSSATNKTYSANFINGLFPKVEYGRITSNNMETITMAGETKKGYDLVFDNEYNEPPIVLVTTWNNQYGSYGIIESAVASITTTGCKLLFDYDVSSAQEGIDYLVIGR